MTSDEYMESASLRKRINIHNKLVREKEENIVDINIYSKDKSVENEIDHLFDDI